MRLVLLMVIWMAAPLAAATPLWIEQASKPGPDSPAIGESRFDQIFLQEDNRYRIPYPFAELINFLESGIDNGERNGVRQVFIPNGRSLQRDTPAPDYFRFPRAVITLEGEPLTTSEDAGEVLEYRLFIAHQPKTESLEIISYNDAAGRFEFQVVDNYAAGAAPVVRQANRVMCLSCHQNAAPIFAQKPWTETSFNVEVASRLIATLPQRYDSLIGVITEDAGIIDVLTERANYLSAAQYIWKYGCASRRCRAAILRAILQYRLSGESSFDWRNPSYRNDYFNELKRNWDANWPQGLALASSRIGDRNPFSREAATIEQDPLFSRPAHANWYLVDSILARGIVYRLAGFLTLADIQRIDRRLIDLSQIQAFPIRKHRAKCKQADEGAVSVLACGNNAAADSLRARIEIENAQGKIKSLRVLHLQFPGDPSIWQPRLAVFSERKGRLDIKPSRDEKGLSPRLSNGSRIKSMAVFSEGYPPDDVNLEIELSDEFSALEQAIDQLLMNDSQERSDSLSERAFRRKPVVTGLMQQLGINALQWQQEKTSPATQRKISRIDLNRGLALLNPYCSHCHGDDSINPPGFLHGPAAQQRITRCAPRILTRLKAWQPDFEFAKSPMPPVASLGYSGTSHEAWPKSDHYRILVDAIEQLVEPGYRNDNYDELPSCLPPG